MHHNCFNCHVLEILERIERKLDRALAGGGAGASYDKEIQQDIANLKKSETALSGAVQNAESGQAAATPPQTPA